VQLFKSSISRLTGLELAERRPVIIHNEEHAFRPIL
jgi:hypothetical protein